MSRLRGSGLPGWDGGQVGEYMRMVGVRLIEVRFEPSLEANEGLSCVDICVIRGSLKYLSY